jgi:hypothetical protein
MAEAGGVMAEAEAEAEAAAARDWPRALVKDCVGSRVSSSCNQCQSHLRFILSLYTGL